ncbi:MULTISPECIES: CotH kinase family protein [Marinobacter]|uniref:CotH kinase family protein n=1 Tax=Marinobacter TaxID=2742 RepID=UPI00259A4756|nr:CotH kinase family protein [Marinobacter sp. UBA5687]|tara:strand:- start:2584 stop:4368 length:1785 start_codon:yes stop_codon:yes gene_type:complete
MKTITAESRTFRGGYRWLVACEVLILLQGCGGGGSDSSDPSDFDAPVEPVNVGGDGDLYAPDRVLAVDIRMPADEFRQLRSEARTLASTDRECVPAFEYTEYTARVTIDGESMDKVVVRKKGYMGSLSPSIPSLKLDFNDLQKGRTYQNSSRMTLNNNRQDPSNARQCMAYDQFREAGIAAPRCNYARVTVNGETLGVFTNVEPLKKPFLTRAFGNDEGNQYEAQTADFGTWLSQRFEKKTNEKENDRSDLQAVAEALALPDEQMLNVLPQLVDVDQFIRFWAVETLLGAWDSATGNANNFHIYRNPEDGLFHFIPWGADTAFRGDHPLKPLTGVFYRNFRLADRLFQIPEYRAAYYAELENLLETQWDENALTDRLARIRQLTGTTEEAAASLERFIIGNGEPGDDDYQPARRVVLEQAMAAETPTGEVSLLADNEPDCSAPATTALTGNITSQSGNDRGEFNFTLPDGRNVSASLTYAAFEVDSLVYSVDRETKPAVVSLLMIGVDAGDSFKPYVLQLFIESSDYVPGSHRFHGFATNALLFEVDESLPGDVRTIALGAQGQITLTSVGTGEQAGDVAITLDATLEYVADVP